MGSHPSHESDQPAEQGGDPQPESVVSDIPNTRWTHEKSDMLQAAVDKIFGTGSASLLEGLDFSFTIADPQLDGCPLIGCSTGFTTLCGYEMSEIVGRNCRFLVDPVPTELVDQNMRVRCKEFCIAGKEGRSYRLPPHELDPWLPEDRPANELFAVQKNARKNGELFNNMFYMKMIDLGDFDDEQTYLIALQSELPGGRQDLSAFGRNLRQLDRNMAKVETILAKEFIITSSMRRQDEDFSDEDDLIPRKKDADDDMSLIPSCAQGA